jgi:hypothetical protein
MHRMDAFVDGLSALQVRRTRRSFALSGTALTTSCVGNVAERPGRFLGALGAQLRLVGFDEQKVVAAAFSDCINLNPAVELADGKPRRSVVLRAYARGALGPAKGPLLLDGCTVGWPLDTCCYSS